MFDLKNDKNFMAQKSLFDEYYNRVLLPKLKENDKIKHRYFLMFIVLLLMSIIFYPLVLLAILIYISIIIIKLKSLLVKLPMKIKKT